MLRSPQLVARAVGLLDRELLKQLFLLLRQLVKSPDVSYISYFQLTHFIDDVRNPDVLQHVFFSHFV